MNNFTATSMHNTVLQWCKSIECFKCSFSIARTDYLTMLKITTVGYYEEYRNYEKANTAYSNF